MEVWFRQGPGLCWDNSRIPRTGVWPKFVLELNWPSAGQVCVATRIEHVRFQSLTDLREGSLY